MQRPLKATSVHGLGIAFSEDARANPDRERRGGQRSGCRSIDAVVPARSKLGRVWRERNTPAASQSAAPAPSSSTITDPILAAACDNCIATGKWSIIALEKTAPVRAIGASDVQLFGPYLDLMAPAGWDREGPAHNGETTV